MGVKKRLLYLTKDIHHPIIQGSKDRNLQARTETETTEQLVTGLLPGLCLIYISYITQDQLSGDDSHHSGL